MQSQFEPSLFSRPLSPLTQSTSHFVLCGFFLPAATLPKMPALLPQECRKPSLEKGRLHSLPSRSPTPISGLRELRGWQQSLFLFSLEELLCNQTCRWGNETLCADSAGSFLWESRRTKRSFPSHTEWLETSHTKRFPVLFCFFSANREALWEEVPGLLVKTEPPLTLSPEG